MVDDTDNPETGGAGPESLLPYDTWTEEALRLVPARALAHVASQGLPGDHHFYLTFRTDLAGVVVPPRLRAQYPTEMTIVLQHQFWDLAVDDAAGVITVGLSFGGVPTTLRIPLTAMTGFADPHVRFGLRFHAPAEAEAEAPPRATGPSAVAALAPPALAPPAEVAPDTGPQVVSLDAFRRRGPPKEGS